MSEENKKIAIVGGNGTLTTLLSKSSKDQGYSNVGIAITNEAKSNLETNCDKVYAYAPGQVSKILKVLKTEEINEMVFIGKVPKLDLLKNFYKLDFKAIKYLRELKNLNDDSIHDGLVKILKKEGIDVLPQTKFLKHLFIEQDILSERKPTLEERIDIEYGFDIAKKVASLDIGQTVVVKDKMILAVEAIEGTDEAIKRGCKLSKKEVVVVKVAKPDQDQRFDIPAVGVTTIKSIAKNGGGILAFEGGQTLVADKEATIEAANKYNVCLLAI